MKMINILVSEHVIIRQFLANMSYALSKLERGENPPRELFEQACFFAREFVDKYHHFKEEHQMFVLLAQKSIGSFDIPIDALRYQHENGRDHITAITECLSAYDEGSEEKTTVLIENLAAYVSMLKQHIHKEDHVFYPMAATLLSSNEQEHLLSEFNKANEKAGEDFLDDIHERILKMEAMLTVA